MTEYQCIIVGSGQGGTPLARALAAAGRSTVLVESRHVGGTCVNEGCTPTKTMVASARVAYLARRAADYGVLTGTVQVDLRKVRERKRGVVESFRSGSESRLESQENLQLIRGSARFTSQRTLEVATVDGSRIELRGEQVFIDTGTRPSMPRLPGLEEIKALDSTSIMELDKIPEHLLVIGGGYIGLEFGQMFRRFGAGVTIVQRGPQLLGREDSDVAQEVLKILREDGIEVLLDSTPSSVRRKGSGGICLEVACPEGQRGVEGSHLLAAVGRVPNTDELDLNRTGVEVDSRGFIRVNERLETSAPGVYALGDVKGGAAFTHISYDDYRILRANLLEGGRRTVSDRPVPYTVFIDPQLGRVGLSEREARERGLRYKVAKIPMSWVARALEVDESRGLIKALVDEDGGRILGCAVLGIEGGELMAALQIAMMGGLPYTALRDGVFAHPCLSESLNTLFGSLQ
ncbi:MAG: mercuric reductase [Spirochaetales bacterium]|nr:mercuric reductase [Spirochaetales bacterium]